MKPGFASSFYMIILLGISACSTHEFDKGRDEIPHGARLIKPVYSNLFSLAVFSGDTFLTLNDPFDTAKELGTYCWGTGTRAFIKIKRIGKRRSMVLTSAVFVGMVESLHAESQIIGVDNGDYITSPRTVRRIEKGDIVSVAKSGTLSKEAVARLKPDLLIGYFIDPKGRENLEQAGRSGCTVMFFQNFLENHPLGRAEWVKVFGFLTGHAQEAMNQFAEIEEHYLNTAMRAEEAKSHPVVLINAPFSGIWDIPAGGSYMGKLVSDAGGAYAFADLKGTGRVAMDIEKVYKKAGEAHVWINPGACRDMACLKGIEKRLAEFAPFQSKQVYNSTKTQNKKQGNAYWEYGVLRPDLVLLDLFSILHPELEPEHQPVFFEKLK